MTQMGRSTVTRLTEADLTYSASFWCLCGAGMAYRRSPDPKKWIDDAWDCSDILLRRAIPIGQEGSMTHRDRHPFFLWKVKSETNGAGRTTRPDHED